MKGKKKNDQPIFRLTLVSKPDSTENTNPPVAKDQHQARPEEPLIFDIQDYAPEVPPRPPAA